MININHRLRKSQEKELLCRHSVSFQVAVVTVQIKTGRQNSSKFSCSFFLTVCGNFFRHGPFDVYTTLCEHIATT